MFLLCLVELLLFWAALETELRKLERETRINAPKLGLLKCLPDLMAKDFKCPEWNLNFRLMISRSGFRETGKG